jgi:SAM-dependent methyltransferase
MNNNMSHRRDDCRLCGGKKLELVVPFAPTPIADDFVPKGELDRPQPLFPLDLYFCHDCKHLQLLEVIEARYVFRPDYAYASGASVGIVKHFKEYADGVLKRKKPAPGSLVIDIGSNDGTLLSNFKEKGCKVLGIDPAAQLAAKANAAGVETLAEYFTPELAKRLRAERGPAAIVTANNVYAHIDDLGGITDGIRTLLAPDGLFVFEASYVVDVVDKMLLGAVFHEHLCHHAVGPMMKFLSKHGLELVDVQRITIQGGAFIGYAQPKGGPLKPTPEADKLVAMEKERGFYEPGIYREFAKRINALRDEGRALLGKAKAEGKHIAGFGAARGGTTTMFHFGLGDFLEYLVDDSPDKQGLYSPGCHLPVLPTKEIYERKPDYLFLLAWVHAKPIMEKHKAFREAGGKFIIPFPKLEVL